MGLIRPAFESQTLEEERQEAGRIKITVSLNKRDQALLKGLQELFDVESPSTMMRIAMHDHHYAIHHHFSPPFIHYLFKKERNRKSYYEETKQKNATQE